MRRLGVQGALVLLFTWLPIVALAGAGALLIGLRMLYLLAAAAIVMWMARRIAVSPPRHRPLHVGVVALTAGTAGGLAFGGLGFLFGLAVGAALSIGSAYDLELRNSNGLVAPIDSHDPVQQRTVGRLLIFFSTVPLLIVLAALVWVAANR
jgi:hypothetical protein